MVGIFVIERLFGTHWFQFNFALSSKAILAGKFWSFITYSFLHGNEMHLIFNGLVLFMLGRMLVRHMGNQRFFSLYTMAVLLGAVCWFLVNGWKGVGYGSVIGASAGVYGLIYVFSRIQPNAKFLLFFIIPVTARQLVFGLLILDGFGMLVYEILSEGSLFGVRTAHSAHLGGFLAGWLFMKFVLNKDFSFSKPDITPPKWFRKKSSTSESSGGFSVNMTSRSQLEKEVNRILDKINTSGFGSLTQEEKDSLDQAKDKLGR